MPFSLSVCFVFSLSCRCQQEFEKSHDLTFHIIPNRLMCLSAWAFHVDCIYWKKSSVILKVHLLFYIWKHLIVLWFWYLCNFYTVFNIFCSFVQWCFFFFCPSLQISKCVYVCIKYWFLKQSEQIWMRFTFLTAPNQICGFIFVVWVFLFNLYVIGDLTSLLYFFFVTAL